MNYQGTKLVCTGQYDTISGNILGFELYEFNALTGQVGSSFNVPFIVPGGDILQYFEFTFSGNYLYAGGNFSLYRFDLTSGDPGIIATSGTLVPLPNQNSSNGAAQHGPDSNLYYVIGNKLLRIENPDNLNPGPISELPSTVAPSCCLPQWIFLLPEFNPVGVITQTTDSCLQTNQIFTISEPSLVNSILWNFDEPSSGVRNTSSLISPTHIFSEVGQYTISAVVNYTCGLDTAYQTLTLVNCESSADDCQVYIPNVFSPNNDGDNDSFYPHTNCIFEHFYFMIFDRWGNKLFASSNQSIAWDGKFRGLDCTNGVYTYYISFKFSSQQPQIQTGTITVLR